MAEMTELERACVEACKRHAVSWLAINMRPAETTSRICYDAGRAVVEARNRWRAEKDMSGGWLVLGPDHRVIWFPNERQARAVADALDKLEDK